MPETYPLDWPDGWNRTAPGDRKPGGKFKVSQKQAIGELYDEAERIGALPVLSTNLQLRLDGYPLSKQRAIDDPGAALYFQRGGSPTVIACDTYDDLTANIRGIGLTLEAMRTIERHGATELLERAFMGFQALPAPEQWHQVLGIASGASNAEIDAAYRQLAKSAHPDRGGSETAMSRLNAARDAGRKAGS